MSGLSIAKNDVSALPASARLLFRMLERIDRGQLELHGPDGRQWTFTGPRPGPRAQLELLDWGVCGAILQRGDVGFAECWIDGRWQTDDLDAVLLLAALNQQALDDAIRGRWWATLIDRLRHLARPNTRRGSRRNIHAHYDLGNDFYRLWLDSSMTYSSALFGGDLDQSLTSAQLAKYERIADRLGLRAGDHVLEIGCGWGGFAAYVAEIIGCRVTGVTVSEAQLAYARERISAAGLEHLVTFSLTDYRDLEGQYDAVVSIEMFEAVGERYWPAYFDVVRSCLKPGRSGLVQTITIAESKFERYRTGTDFIQQYIFPGGMLPSPTRFAELAERSGLEVTDRHAFGLDYAETLRRWHAKFNEVSDIVETFGFDERFLRLWRFYLSYCEAGFRSGSTDVMQITLARG